MLRQPVNFPVALLVGIAGAGMVLPGAIGAHALCDVLDAPQCQLWHTALDDHAWHTLAGTGAPRHE